MWIYMHMWTLAVYIWTATFDVCLSKEIFSKPEISITAAGGHVVAQPLGLQLPLLLLGDRHVVDLGNLLYNLHSCDKKNQILQQLL